jgi:peptidyl-prolyl cis-trans isomerase C
MRLRLTPVTALMVATLTTTALAAPPAKAPAPAGNPVLATVNGDPIRMSDLATLAQGLSPREQQQMQQIPPEQLAGRLLENLISEKALLLQAKKEGLDRDPKVAKQIQASTDQILASAALRNAVLPKLTEDAIKAAYDKEYAGKPGEEEVHARHILVDSEAKAKDIIAQLDKGAKFEDLAKKYGDPKDASTQQGGDLGFFKKGDMMPEFSTAAFGLKVNEYTHTPVHTHYGWHVIQVLETRISQPPAYDQIHDQLKQQLGQQLMAQTIQSARAAAKVQIMKPPAPPAAAAPAAPAAPAGK